MSPTCETTTICGTEQNTIMDQFIFVGYILLVRDVSIQSVIYLESLCCYASHLQVKMFMFCYGSRITIGSKTITKDNINGQGIICLLKAMLTTPLDSLMDLTASLKVKKTEGKGVGACSLACSILGVEGCAGTPRWGLGQVTSKSIIHMDLHKPNNKLVNA